MYICDRCGTQSYPNEKQHMQVIQVRETGYPAQRNYFHRDRREHKREGKEGRGFEIAREIKVCRNCAKGSFTPTVIALPKEELV